MQAATVNSKELQSMTCNRLESQRPIRYRKPVVEIDTPRLYYS